MRKDVVFIYSVPSDRALRTGCMIDVFRKHTGNRAALEYRKLYNYQNIYSASRETFPKRVFGTVQYHLGEVDP